MANEIKVTLYTESSSIVTSYRADQKALATACFDQYVADGRRVTMEFIPGFARLKVGDGVLLKKGGQVIDRVGGAMTALDAATAADEWCKASGHTKSFDTPPYLNTANHWVIYIN